MANVLTRPILLLNNSYEPLNVISVARALRLLATQKANGAEKEGYDVRSVSGVVCVPVVIKMSYFVRRPNQRTKFSKKNVLMRDDFTCMYCGQKNIAGDLTIDHVIPKTAGGTTTWINVVAACRRCNSEKGDKSLKDSGMKLLKAPREPRFLPYLRMVKGRGAHVWDKYLFLDSSSPYLIRDELPKDKKSK